jgi:hypothetical protein
MSIIGRDQELLDKRCFVYCGPERCNCQAGSAVNISSEEFQELFRKSGEQARKEVAEKDKEHQYDRAMEILDKDTKPKDVV